MSLEIADLVIKIAAKGRFSLRVCFFFVNKANQINQTNQLEKKYIVGILVCFDHVTQANNGERAF